MEILLNGHESVRYIAEFWSVCTRLPSAHSAIGLLPSEAEREARVIEHYFRLAPDSLTTYKEWRQLRVRHTLLKSAPPTCPASA